MRNAIAWLLAASAVACGGQVQNAGDDVTAAPVSSGPSSAQGAYVLSRATLSDGSAFGRAVMPLAQSLCPSTPIESWTATVAVDASGQGLMVLSSPCLLIHVPLEAAVMGNASLTALVPTQALVAAWSGDLSASDQSGAGACDTAKIIGTRMRSASDATVSVDGSSSVAALTLDVQFGTREPGSAPAPAPTDPCAGRD